MAKVSIPACSLTENVYFTPKGKKYILYTARDIEVSDPEDVEYFREKGFSIKEEVVEAGPSLPSEPELEIIEESEK